MDLTEGNLDTEFEFPKLKLAEPVIEANDPWADDKLDRIQVADRLTKIIEGQDAPFVISLDGRWGTGKTFLLKRWQQDLLNNRFNAIYFNAWEDDFCDNPLLGILGQLSKHFDGGKFEDFAKKVADIGLKLLTNQLIGTAISFDDFKPESIFDDYHAQIRTKEELKTQIAALADKVKQEQGQPLVFIVDELDRCRPTFAIELLERVKHIFDVPNVVFVFGINRQELQASLKSVYGDIDAGVYLRRFFDMEFALPAADPVKFCSYLVQTSRLEEYFDRLSGALGNNFHSKEYRTITEVLPLVFGRMGFSLRDIDYSIRFVALVARSVKLRSSIFPVVLCALVAVKISNPELYLRYVHGRARAAELIDHMNERRASVGLSGTHPGVEVPWAVAYLEASLYATDGSAIAMRQLKLLQEKRQLDRPEFLAKLTAELDPDSDLGNRHVENVIRALEGIAGQLPRVQISAPHIAALIDLFDRDSLRTFVGISTEDRFYD